MSKSLLNTEQKEKIAEYIANGGSLRDASVRCLDLFGIEISYSTIAGYDEVKQAQVLKARLRAQETKETLDKAITPFVGTLVKNGARIEAKIEELETALKGKMPGSAEYTRIENALAKRYKAFSDLLARFNQMQDKTFEMNKGAVDEIQNQRDNMSSLNDLLRGTFETKEESNRKAN